MVRRQSKESFSTFSKVPNSLCISEDNLILCWSFMRRFGIHRAVNLEAWDGECRILWMDPMLNSVRHIKVRWMSRFNGGLIDKDGGWVQERPTFDIYDKWKRQKSWSNFQRRSIRNCPRDELNLSVHRILHEDLKVYNLNTRWIPRRLTTDHWELGKEERSFLRLWTVDESWLHMYQKNKAPVSKQAIIFSWSMSVIESKVCSVAQKIKITIFGTCVE